MNNEQLKLLSHMKKLIKNGKRRFLPRNDRDYTADLFEIGIIEEEAWNVHILSLNKNFYYFDPIPNYKVDGKTLVFLKKINGNLVYIKLKLEIKIDGEEVVCISFHISN